MFSETFISDRLSNPIKWWWSCFCLCWAHHWWLFVDEYWTMSSTYHLFSLRYRTRWTSMTNTELVRPAVSTNCLKSLNKSSSESWLFQSVEELKSLSCLTFRYVPSIKSSENFIDTIVNRQRENKQKIKVLTFLNRCLEITRMMIQYEIDGKLNDKQNPGENSHRQLSYSLDELDQAQQKVEDLLLVVEQRLNDLKNWLPPTIPFLGFFWPKSDEESRSILFIGSPNDAERSFFSLCSK